MREVEVSYGFTRNIGDFNSIRYQASYRDTIKEGETYEEAHSRVEDAVTARVQAALDQVNEEYG